MVKYTLADFPGETEEEKKRNCYDAFTKRQQNRLDHLVKSTPFTEPAIGLEKWEYAEWVNESPENQKLHDDLEVATEKHKVELAAKRDANKKAGAALANVHVKRPVPSSPLASAPVRTRKNPNRTFT